MPRLNTPTTAQITVQATALALALVTTLSLMGGIDQLAKPAASPLTLASKAPAATQVIVITGKRLAQA